MVRSTLLVLMMTQAAWAYAQVGWVICVHEGGQALAEPSGDLCCGPEKTANPHRGADGEMAIEPGDPCPCSDFALSLVARQIVERPAPAELAATNPPSNHYVDVELLKQPTRWTESSHIVAGYDPPSSRSQVLLKSVVLRI